jgi:hypothetical protein
VYATASVLAALEGLCDKNKDSKLRQNRSLLNTGGSPLVGPKFGIDVGHANVRNQRKDRASYSVTDESWTMRINGLTQARTHASSVISALPFSF